MHKHISNSVIDFWVLWNLKRIWRDKLWRFSGAQAGLGHHLLSEILIHLQLVTCISKASQIDWEALQLCYTYSNTMQYLRTCITYSRLSFHILTIAAIKKNTQKQQSVYFFVHFIKIRRYIFIENWNWKKGMWRSPVGEIIICICFHFSVKYSQKYYPLFIIEITFIARNRNLFINLHNA